MDVALETELAFNDKDDKENVKFIDNLQDFLTKVRNTVVKNYRRHGKIQRRRLRHTSILKCTDFIKRLIQVLKQYDNKDLEDVFAVADDEIRKYHYKGRKLYELFTNNNTQRRAVKKQSAKSIRNILNETLQLIDDASGNPSRRQSELLTYVDSLYTKSDIAVFHNILENFEAYSYKRKSKRANMDLVKLINDTMRILVFDHYSSLNINTSRDFRMILETLFWIEDNKSFARHQNWSLEHPGKSKTQKFYQRQILIATTPEITSLTSLEEKGRNKVYVNNSDERYAVSNEPTNLDKQTEHAMSDRDDTKPDLESRFTPANKNKHKIKFPYDSENKTLLNNLWVEKITTKKHNTNQANKELDSLSDEPTTHDVVRVTEMASDILRSIIIDKNNNFHFLPSISNKDKLRARNAKLLPKKNILRSVQESKTPNNRNFYINTKLQSISVHKDKELKLKLSVPETNV